MTYSVESLVFRVAAGVVNTAARAANGLLEVMYPPRYDAAHIWEDVPADSVASGGPAPTDPPSGGVADPAAEKVNPPDLSAAGSPLSFGDCFDCCVGHPEPPLTWNAWAEPAILDVLAQHYPIRLVGDEAPRYRCNCDLVALHLEEWREHVAPLIADRIGCDPTRAALALTSLQTQ